MRCQRSSEWQLIILLQVCTLYGAAEMYNVPELRDCCQSYIFKHASVTISAFLFPWKVQHSSLTRAPTRMQTHTHTHTHTHSLSL